MTIKYESEILFDLMKRDGDDTPSDVLPYESELKEKYLNQVVGAYPKLQDYRAEWLNYNLCQGLPSDFPTESVTNVTSASFENVVPYAYNSAILKGNTGYRDIDTGEFLETFEEGRNLELVSVQMPVLTTTGKNLFDYKDFKRVVENGGETSLYPINLESNTTYTFSDETGQWNGCGFFLELKDEYNNVVTQIINSNLSNRKTFTFTTNSSKQFYLYMFKNGIEKMDSRSSNFQIEKGSTATSYEPYKSNILTVNEEVTLRGIGDVQDKLDCLTGEVTESIGEIVLDGTQYMESDGYGVYIQVNDVKRFLDYTDKIACDKLPVIPSYWDSENVENGISGYTNSSSYLGQNWLYVKINNSVNTDEVKEWLTQNPITVQYQRVTDSVKTVDLSCVNEHGENETFRPFEGTMHVSTSSQTLPPLLDMSVPVEATTQNLMSFANIEWEE